MILRFFSLLLILYLLGFLLFSVTLGGPAGDRRTDAAVVITGGTGRIEHAVRLITSDWHMRRALYEFGRVLGDKYEIVPDGVRSQPRFLTLFGEYNKYVLRRIAVLLEL